PRFTSVRSMPVGVVALSQELGRLLGATLGVNDLHAAVKELLGTPPSTGVAPWQIAFASGFLTSIEKRNGPSLSDFFPAFSQTTTNSASRRRDFLTVAEQRSRTLCADKGAVVELREAAVDLLARLRATDDKLA